MRYIAAHMTSRSSSLACASLLLLLGACAAQTTEKPADDSESTEQDISAKKLNIVGSVDMDTTTASTKFTGGTKYAALKFSGNTGDEVDLWVKSSNGDPVAWVLDNDFKTIAKNDDATSSDTNSHIKLKLPANASATHYIVVRDYWLSPMSFKVSLAGADYTGTCNQDSDCAEVAKSCCTNLGDTAVLGSKAASYTASLNCAEAHFCPAIVLPKSYATAECNRTSHKCEMVQPADVVCGGHTIPSAQHACPAGFTCNGDALAWDGPGHCSQFCGGFAGLHCSNANETCQDDPNDDCDPKNGGRDCGGLCQPAK